MDKTETLQAWNYDGTPITLTWMNRSPVSGKWQIPADVTLTEPPEAKDGFTLSFDGEAWQYTEVKDDTPTLTEPTEPTAEDKLLQLDAEYELAKKDLYNYFIDALIHGDTDLMEELKTEMTDLDTQYAESRAELEGSEE